MYFGRINLGEKEMFLAHISDLHIGDADKPGLANINKIVRCINGLDVKVDAVLVTGDLIHQRSKKHYEACFAELNKLKIPYYAIVGNHDKPEHLSEALAKYCPSHPQTEMGGYLQYCVDDYPVRIIALDTYADGCPNGLMTEDKLAWLEEKLADNPAKKPVLVMIHQFTMKTKLTFFDSYLQDWFGQFNEIIARHKDTVKLVACGHLHNSLIGNIDGVPMVSTFSTNWQAYFDFTAREYMVANKLPVGFYIHRFDEDKFMSYVVAIPKEFSE